MLYCISEVENMYLSILFSAIRNVKFIAVESMGINPALVWNSCQSLIYKNLITASQKKVYFIALADNLTIESYAGA